MFPIVIVGWYPYPFMDVGQLGYIVVGVACLAIGASMVGLAVCAMWVDRRLTDTGERGRSVPMP